MDRDPLFIFISGKGGLIKRGSSHHAPHFTLPTTTTWSTYTETWRPIALIQEEEEEKINDPRPEVERKRRQSIVAEEERGSLPLNWQFYTAALASSQEAARSRS